MTRRPFFLFRPTVFRPIILLAVLVALAFICDGRVDSFFSAERNSHADWKGLASFVSRYADWPFLILYALIVFVVGLVRKSDRIKTIAIAIGLSCFLTGMTATAIRSVTGRTRPSATAPQGFYGLRSNSQWLVGNHDFNSFPSGHVGAAVGFVVPLILAGRRRSKVPAILFCGLMAWARMFSGCHHLSDVIVAAIIGTMGGYCVWRWMIPKYVEPLFAREPATLAIPVGPTVNTIPTIPAFDGRGVSGFIPQNESSFRHDPFKP
jgi:membrane-associated phospholipid phosphatase